MSNDFISDQLDYHRPIIQTGYKRIKHLEDFSLHEKIYDNFTCPDERSLVKVPLKCKLATPVYPSRYRDSTITMIAPKEHPGPSEQMHGLRDVIITVMKLGKSLAVNPMTRHKKDFLY